VSSCCGCAGYAGDHGGPPPEGNGKSAPPPPPPPGGEKKAERAPLGFRTVSFQR
jgi:hypothetical protein